MKKLLLLLVGLTLIWGFALASELEYFQVYKPKEGMTAVEVMRIENFI